MAMTFDSAFRSIRMLARDREYYISHNIFHGVVKQERSATEKLEW